MKLPTEIDQFEYQAVNMFVLTWESMGTDSLLPPLDARGTAGLEWLVSAAPYRLHRR